jgi:PAS domain S-box-containing protein
MTGRKEDEMEEQTQQEKELLEEVRSLRAALKFQSEQAESQSTLVAAAMDAIIAVDKTQNIIQFNAAAEQVFGYQAVDIIGKSLHLLLPEHFRQSHHTHIQKFGAHGTTTRTTHSLGTLSGRRANGETFPIEVSISRARVGGRMLYFAILRDMGDRLKMEELLLNQYDSLNTLHRITLDLLNQRDVQEMLHFIVLKAAKFLDAPYCEILLPEKDELVAKASTQNELFSPGTRIKQGEGRLSWKVFDSGVPAMLDDYSQWAERHALYEKQNFKAALVIPMLVGKQCIGVLGFARFKPNQPFRQEDILSATQFADIATLAMENSRLYREVAALATTDELTGIHNRRSLLELGNREVLRSQRYARPLSALMLDVDHFKHVNDTWGHTAGDIVLQGIAQHCVEQLRNTDALGRYAEKDADAENIIGRLGGEEFAILLPETNLDQALFVAERIRASVERMLFKVPGANGGPNSAMLHVTVSIGVASLNPEMDAMPDLLNQADKALYTAKQTGRNRVCMNIKDNASFLPKPSITSMRKRMPVV